MDERIDTKVLKNGNTMIGKIPYIYYLCIAQKF